LQRILAASAFIFSAFQSANNFEMFRILSGFQQNCGNHLILIKLRALGVGFELEGTGIAKVLG
jgi:hypothetical protein